MNLLSEIRLSQFHRENKYFFSDDDCQIVAKKEIKRLLEKTMLYQIEEVLDNNKHSNGKRIDRRNGYYERSLLSSWGWINNIKVPRGRKTSIAGEILRKYKRTQPEFDAAVINSYLLGHTTRKAKEFFELFLKETTISHTQVSNILKTLDSNCRRWRNRKIKKKFDFLWLDGKCAKIKGATKWPYSVLWAYGGTFSGEIELLGFEIHRSEALVHWECFLNHLLKRNLDPEYLKLIIRDENSACNSAVLTTLGNIPQQSCAIHLERNLGKLVDKTKRKLFQKNVSEIFKQRNLSAAKKMANLVLNKWKSIEPTAIKYLKKNLDKSLVFYEAVPEKCYSFLKGTNVLERFFRELKRFEKARQFRYATIQSCERFYYALAYDYNKKHQRLT